MIANSEIDLINILGLRFDPSLRVAVNINWTATKECARKNRMLPLLHSVAASVDGVPGDVLQGLHREAQLSFVATTLVAQEMKDVSAALDRIPWMLLRGPVLGEMVYGNLALRPFGDLDVLVAPESVDAALARLSNAGFLPSANSFPISFYRNYHLHVQLGRVGLAGDTSLELHWALDHPFTLLTVDIAGMLSRREMMIIDHLEVARPCLEDLIVSLAIHAVKHAAPLKQWIAQHDSAAIAGHGMLLHFYDIACLIHHYGTALDWDAAEQRSRDWGADGLLSQCLQAIDLLWPASLPTASVRQRWQEVTSNRQSLAARSDDRTHNALAFKQLRGAVFRPIRMLDAFAYVLPPGSYLVRRYQSSSLMTRVRHTMQALLRLGSGGIALLYHSSRSRLQRAIRASRGVGK